jgi:hypothetical protein
MAHLPISISGLAHNRGQQTHPTNPPILLLAGPIAIFLHHSSQPIPSLGKDKQFAWSPSHIRMDGIGGNFRRKEKDE